MYGLPEGFNGAFFVGRELEIVSFSANTISLYFDSAVSLTIESSYECRWTVDEDAIESHRVPVSTSRLMELIGRKVTSVEVENSGTLVLVFDCGAVFRCFDDQVAFESYRIAHGRDEIFV